jgi:hypothetical protein
MTTMKCKRVALTLLGCIALAAAFVSLLVDYTSGFMANPMYFDDAYKIAEASLALVGGIGVIAGEYFRDLEKRFALTAKGKKG